MVAADRNLLFGILALQMDFVNRDTLIAGMNAWVLRKDQPLGEILVQQGTVAEDERRVLDMLVEKHLARHGGDAQRSLVRCRPLRRTVSCSSPSPTSSCKPAWRSGARRNDEMAVSSACSMRLATWATSRRPGTGAQTAGSACSACTIAADWARFSLRLTVSSTARLRSSASEQHADDLQLRRGSWSRPK